MDFEKLYEFLPKTTEKWSIEDVALWLNFIGLGNYSDKFKQTAIDGASILLLENDDLINDLQITSSMIRKKILNWSKHGLKEYSSFILQKHKILREVNMNNKENMNMFLENKESLFEIPQKKDLFKKASSQEDCLVNDNTNPIAHPSRYFSNENNNNMIEFDHLSTSNVNKNVNPVQNPQFQDPQNRISPFNHQNPFTNALTSEQTNELGNFYSNQNPFMQNHFMYMDNQSNPLNVLFRNDKQPQQQIPPFPFPKNYRANSIHNANNNANNNAGEMQDEEDMTKSNPNNQNRPQQARVEIENKENLNISPLVSNAAANQPESELIIQPTEGAQTTFYCIKNTGGKIGRHSSNQMVILEESVSRYHAEILYKNQEFYIRDIGSTTGTFLKITSNMVLETGMIIEMGSNQFLIEEMVCNNNAGEMHITICEGPDVGQRLVVSLKDQLSNNSIGRKNSTTFAFPNDQHLSNIHAKFFILDNKFYLEDLSSTNGSWRRLSREGETSPIFLLNDQTVFKIGTTSTFVVNKQVGANGIRKMELEACNNKGDCIICCENERDALYLPCKHNTACLKCSKNLRECPICKLKIEDIIKIYRA